MAHYSSVTTFSMGKHYLAALDNSSWCCKILSNNFRDALPAQGADGRCRRRGAGGATAASREALAAAAARGAMALLPASLLRVPRAARVGLGLELRHDVRRDGAGLDAHARVADAHELDVALPPPRPGDPVIETCFR